MIPEANFDDACLWCVVQLSVMMMMMLVVHLRLPWVGPADRVAMLAGLVTDVDLDSRISVLACFWSVT